MTFVGTLKKLGYIALFLLLMPLIPVLVGGITTLYNRYLDPRTQVAVLPIKGVLYDSSYHSKQLNRFFKDDQIKAILLKIECAGSASGTGSALFQELRDLKQIYPKPVIVLVENICASGGYYIASAADYIIASPMAMVGSIGVTIPYFFQLKDFAEYHKVKHIPLSAGAYKNATNPFSNVTPEQKQMLQAMIDDSYDQFASDIAQQRNLNLDQKKEWADGLIFNGRQALQLGLVDELGSVSTAIKAIKEKADIQTDIKWVHAPSRTGFWSIFGGESEDDQTFISCMANEIVAVAENRYTNQSMRC